jgi:predicted CoA-binding protein
VKFIQETRMKNSRQAIDAFLANKTIAVVGVSHNGDKFGNYLYRAVRQAGYKVYAVNPNLDMAEGDRCYAGLGALPEKPDGVVLVVPPQATLQVLDDMGKLGIHSVWIQQGADSTEGDKKAAELGINLVSGECLMLVLEPVQSVHRWHRAVRKLIGRIPK